MISNKLRPSDTIGIISPASYEEEANIRENLSLLKDLGFKIKKGKYINKKRGYLAGTDEERAQDFMDMFLDQTIDAIFCIRGGYGSMRILNLIDWDIIKNNPKIFVGFSDITTLLNNIYDKTNLITFHGPMLTSNFRDVITLKNLLDTLSGGDKPYEINLHESNAWGNDKGCCSGDLVGGNLALIASTLGTPYEINLKDKVLFLEDVGESPYRIDRELTQLLLSGKLDECKGFILGYFTNCERQSGNSLTLNEVIQDRILSLNKPTIVNFPSGHNYPKLTLPIGANIYLDSSSTKIKILEPVVK